MSWFEDDGYRDMETPDFCEACSSRHCTCDPMMTCTRCDGQHRYSEVCLCQKTVVIDMTEDIECPW